MCPICGQNLSDVKKGMQTEGFSVEKLVNTFAIFKQTSKIETFQEQTLEMNIEVTIGTTVTSRMFSEKSFM